MCLTHWLKNKIIEYNWFILSLDLAPTMFVRNIVGVFSETYFFETAISKKIQPAMSDEPPIGATAPHIVTPVAQIK